MKKVVWGLLLIFSLLLLVYVAFPSPGFPEPPLDSPQSMEPADTEDPLRRAYFTDYTREEVVSHYQEQFNITPYGFKLLPLRLNYPPEEAYTLIRDQTRSTFLEELVHPLRESFYINGFKPSSDKDDIWINKVHYRQKITVRLYPRNPLVSVVVVVLAAISIWLVFREYPSAILDLIKKK